MVFYAVDIDDIYNTCVTFPDFSLEDITEVLEEDKSLQRCKIMTTEEFKRFRKLCEYTKDYEEIYNQIADDLIYNKYINGEIQDKPIIYSYWVCGVGDLNTKYFVCGADIINDYKFNPIDIAKNIGEKRFKEFSLMEPKRFSKYKMLAKYLLENGYNQLISEKKLKEACDEEKYYIL